MAAEAVTIRPTIDRNWLERAAAVDPLAHAYALWDLDRYPDRIRFVSVLHDELTTGYLLIWRGHPTTPIVHWFGAPAEVRELASFLPPLPVVVIGPEEVRSTVEAVLGPVVHRPLLGLLSDPRAPLPDANAAHRTRRLTPADRPALVELTSGRSEMAASEYPHLDLEVERIWGCFEGSRLRGVARAAVALPYAWIIGGVFVDPETRGRGFGLSLMRAVVAEGRAAGVTIGLRVREDQQAARTIYERAGFRPARRYAWMGAGTDLEP